MKNLFKHSLLMLMAVGMSSCGTSKNEMSLDFEKYTLSNGLEVVLHQDTSDPVVTVAIQYHVGSNREKPGKTGFAHFFEHMLFQRSENLPRNAFFQKIDAMGGSFNGGTWNDGTVYYETVPRDALEKVLWMESDRMGYFINTVTEGGLKREIDVVSNEKRQGENAPYGLSSDLLFKNLFEPGHPYSWTVIGEIPDLRSATVEDVKEFYSTYYNPKNATLVVAGDFDPAQVKELLEKYFAEIASGEKPAPLPVQNPVLSETKKISYEDAFANAPMIEIAYPAVEMYNEDSYALDFLTSILASDKKSPLYKVLVEEKKLMPSVNSFIYGLELAGFVLVEGTTFPNVNLNDVYAGVEEAYARFEKEGFSDKDLERYKVMKETQLYNSLTSTNGKAIAMAQDNVFGGTPDRSIKELAKYKAVTREDIMRVYDKYIKGKNYLVISIVPKGNLDLAIVGSVPTAVEQESISEQQLNSEAGEIVDDPYTKTASKIDRSVEPELLSNTPELKVPEIWSATLSNGMDVKGIDYTELPLVNFAIELGNGMLQDDPSKVGVAYLTATMLNEGTALKTPEELEDAIGQLGAHIRVSSSAENTVISGNCLKSNFPAVLALVEEMLLQPRFDENAFAVVKERALDNIRQRKTQPSAIGLTVFKKLIHGDDSILAEFIMGTEESIGAITMDDLKAFYAANYSPSVAKMSFVGGLSQREVEKELSSLTKNWAAKEVAPVAINETNVAQASKIYFVDYPDARQSYIMIGSKAMPYNSPEAYPAEIVNDKLGASSGSLLFEILRLQRGYTYGAYSSFNSNNYLNTFNAHSSVQATVTKESVELFRDIIKNYGNDYSAEWLSNSTNAMLRLMNGSFETPAALLGMMRSLYIYNLPNDYVKQRENLLKTITLDQAKAHIAKNINFDDMIIVVVGDAKTQMAPLNNIALGKVMLVDQNGKAIK